MVETCQQCHGTGQVRTTQNFMGMQMQSSTVCPRCNGKGKIIKTPCSTCRGKGKVRRTNRVKVKIPAGVDAGQSVRVQPGTEGTARCRRAMKMKNGRPVLLEADD